MQGATRRSLLTHAALGLALTGCQADLPPDPLTVFDAVWEFVDEWYFDPTMNGLDWQAIRRDWRPKAAAAETPAALYLDVLIPVLDRFQTSHIDLRPPGGSLMLTNGRTFPIPRQKRGRPFFMVTREDEAGMGAMLTWTGSAYVVENVIAGSPAQLAGLRPGQLVHLAAFRASEAPREMRLIDLDGSRLTVNWTPKIAPARTERRALGHGTALLRFDAFDQSSVDWAVNNLNASTSHSIVLDLRQNSGGLIVAMERLTSTLLPEGSDLGHFGSRNRDFPIATLPVPARFKGPLAVLIGPRSASAAEITAAVLQHHGRARLFGTTTSGSVLAAKKFDLPDGGELSLPYADYHAPSGKRIEERGVSPDEVLFQTAASMAEGRDPAVDAALAWLSRQ